MDITMLFGDFLVLIFERLMFVWFVFWLLSAWSLTKVWRVWLVILLITS